MKHFEQAPGDYYCDNRLLALIKPQKAPLQLPAVGEKSVQKVLCLAPSRDSWNIKMLLVKAARPRWAAAVCFQCIHINWMVIVALTWEGEYVCVCARVYSQPQASTEWIYFIDVWNFRGHLLLAGDGLPHGSILGPLSLYGSRWKKTKTRGT